MRFEAVNNVLILKKDTENEFNRLSVKDMKQIPPPYTGVVDSVGYDDCGYKVGDRVAFEEIGGVLLSTEIEDYVVITPEMVIGVL
jgi:co-chaperonin GroES (HSP10)